MHACMLLDTIHFDYSESTIAWSCNIVFDPINVRTARINVEQRKRRLDHDKWPVYSGDDFHEFVINWAAEVDLLHGGKVYFCVETVLLGIDVACSQPMIKEAAGRVDTPVGVRGRWSSICPKPRGKKVKEYWMAKRSFKILSCSTEMKIIYSHFPIPPKNHPTFFDYRALPDAWYGGKNDTCAMVIDTWRKYDWHLYKQNLGHQILPDFPTLALKKKAGGGGGGSAAFSG